MNYELQILVLPSLGSTTECFGQQLVVCDEFGCGLGAIPCAPADNDEHRVSLRIIGSRDNRVVFSCVKILREILGPPLGGLAVVGDDGQFVIHEVTQSLADVRPSCARVSNEYRRCVAQIRETDGVANSQIVAAPHPAKHTSEAARRDQIASADKLITDESESFIGGESSRGTPRSRDDGNVDRRVGCGDHYRCRRNEDWIPKLVDHGRSGAQAPAAEG